MKIIQSEVEWHKVNTITMNLEQPTPPPTVQVRVQVGDFVYRDRTLKLVCEGIVMFLSAGHGADTQKYLAENITDSRLDSFVHVNKCPIL